MKRWLGLAAVGAAWLVTACAGTAPAPVVTSQIPPREQGYLPDPTSGYPLTADPELTARLRAAWEGLALGWELARVEAAARELQAVDAGFHPAAVLRAQVDFLRREDRAALDLLSPVVDELPDYVAAQLLRGRVAERLGEVVASYQAFRQVAPASRLAAERAEELRTRAAEIVANRLDEALKRGQVEAAEEQLALLEEWLGTDAQTLEAARQIAVARNDPEGELEVSRQLVALAGLESAEPDLVQRLAELEIEVGDVRAGLDAFERLVEEYPDDDDLQRQLDHAKFLWRLQLLPPEIQKLQRKGELSRADFARLLYWLVPQIRSARVTNPPIANDILDDPRRPEILRVLSLGLMRVDETLHRFDPGAPVTRASSLTALLMLTELSEQHVSCLDRSELRALRGSNSFLCEKAAQCGLIAEEAECLPWAPLSGKEAVELLQRSLYLLGTG